MAKKFRAKNSGAPPRLVTPRLVTPRLVTPRLATPRLVTPRLATPLLALAAALKSQLLLLLLLTVAGCSPAGPQTYPISGTVSFDGQAVADGYIVFTGSDSTIPPVTAKIVDGKYASRVTADTHRVEIQASRFVGPENPIMGLRAKAQYVPDRYNIESILSIGVEPTGNKIFPFDLTSAAEAAP